MKLRMVLSVVLLVAGATFLSGTCWADGSGSTDPQPTSQGCGGKGQPKCDADLLLPNTPLQVTLVAVDPGDTVDGVYNPFNQDLWLIDIINMTGKAVTNFTATFSDVTSEGNTLDFNEVCAGALTQLGESETTNSPLFPNCSEIGSTSTTATYEFSGGILPPIPSTCNATSNPGGPTCMGMILALVPSDDDTFVEGDTDAGTVVAPEPSSALLLLFGFVGVGLMRFRKIGIKLA